MRPDWTAIVRKLTECNIRVAIITNGYLFSDTLISLLKELKVESVAVSLDGPRKIHDKFRQSGSFQRVNDAINVLTKNHIWVSVISTLHSENVLYLDELYQYLKEKPIAAWQLQACSPMGNVCKSDIDYNFDFNRVIGFVEKNVYDAPFIMGIADNIGYFTESEGFLRGNLSGKAVFRGCQAGITSIGIDSVGNVRGCEYGIICKGGCRSYNYFTHGKLYEAMHCAKDKVS